VADLLVELDLKIARVAVEHNRRVLKRHEFPRVILADGDRLEIVHFVGGG
jgi:thiamine biosynthesis protein ThiS